MQTNGSTPISVNSTNHAFSHQETLELYADSIPPHVLKRIQEKHPNLSLEEMNRNITVRCSDGELKVNKCVLPEFAFFSNDMLDVEGNLEISQFSKSAVRDVFLAAINRDHWPVNVSNWPAKIPIERSISHIPPQEYFNALYAADFFVEKEVMNQIVGTILSEGDIDKILRLSEFFTNRYAEDYILTACEYAVKNYVMGCGTF